MTKKAYKLDKVAIRMVKEPPLYSETPMDHPDNVVKLLAETLREYDREVLCIVNLKGTLQPINLNIASMGTVDSAIAHPREILKSSILSNAKAVLLVHNHPSGDVTPSRHDIHVTEQLQHVFKLLQIDLVDHIIIGGSDQYFSFRNKGILSTREEQYTPTMEAINLEERFPIRKSVMDELAAKKTEAIEKQKEKICLRREALTERGREETR